MIQRETIIGPNPHKGASSSMPIVVIDIDSELWRPLQEKVFISWVLCSQNVMDMY